MSEITNIKKFFEITDKLLKKYEISNSIIEKYKQNIKKGDYSLSNINDYNKYLVLTNMEYNNVIKEFNKNDFEVYNKDFDLNNIEQIKQIKRKYKIKKTYHINIDDINKLLHTSILSNEQQYFMKHLNRQYTLIYLINNTIYQLFSSDILNLQQKGGGIFDNIKSLIASGNFKKDGKEDGKVEDEKEDEAGKVVEVEVKDVVEDEKVEVEVQDEDEVEKVQVEDVDLKVEDEKEEDEKVEDEKVEESVKDDDELTYDELDGYDNNLDSKNMNETLLMLLNKVTDIKSYKSFITENIIINDNNEKILKAYDLYKFYLANLNEFEDNNLYEKLDVKLKQIKKIKIECDFITIDTDDLLQFETNEQLNLINEINNIITSIKTIYLKSDVYKSYLLKILKYSKFAEDDEFKYSLQILENTSSGVIYSKSDEMIDIVINILIDIVSLNIELLQKIENHLKSIDKKYNKQNIKTDEYTNEDSQIVKQEDTPNDTNNEFNISSKDTDEPDNEKVDIARKELIEKINSAGLDKLTRISKSLSKGGLNSSKKRNKLSKKRKKRMSKTHKK